ncbi:MAG TPA: leucine--tRNA ligase [Saccharofermentans sp.]|nr:leucine--tRNA ligase [Saccharofermentans sp.]HPE28200.1 leucine--tRNA ligase [Saccharofermentans sp.]HPG63983.1 leucine--tRNA ligase [Saccharofermentans sp.]HPJ81446.1 leucine--tRNA ligase [Saccharofermentans sp.]HPQ32224.1 leucine--tRNA ligase [Saccharofermentans sp.]
MMSYSINVDRKWQKKWEETGLYKFDPNGKGDKLYCLEMFSYPSGANLHLGHWYNYALTDSWARMKRMQGYNIFHPMGFDAFGLPAENYAIKTGIHPQDSTLNNIETMEKQLREMGASFDWDYEIATCKPDYYKWNQWLFLQLYKNELAYRKNALVNWCPKCNTVLANEQVIDGKCERCDTEIMRKNMTQWFFAITKYAQELLDCLPELDWPEKTKKIQTNWIGRSEGSQVSFLCEKDGKQLVDSDNKPVKLDVFTTRADTFMGVTYVVVAPESEMCSILTTEAQRDEVEKYRVDTSKASEIERQSTTREKTGVFTGSYAIHPLNGRKVPIWASDYVIAGYGTGIVMAVPAHDERDYEFASKFGMDIVRVVASSENAEDELPYCEKNGVLINSDEFNGLNVKEAIDAIVGKLSKMDMGEKKINYRLRDWLISRQRYWGTPIPMIHCQKCGVVPVPEDQLPVLLPYDVEFKPDGESPLAKCDSFINCTCPNCKGPAKRDPDTMDTFMDSSWYEFRYADNKNDKAIFDKEIINKICPVDKYVGGSEHAAMHLLYARFICKAMRDMGLVNFDEPFTSLVHQGIILGPDGNRMSKSRGNTISPDDYVNKFGSDVFRTYLAFGFAYTEGGPWSDTGLQAIVKFTNRIEKLVNDIVEAGSEVTGDISSVNFAKEEKDLNYVINYAIKNVSIDSNRFQFNTSIARMMELINAINKYQLVPNADMNLIKYAAKNLVLLYAPFAPHFTEELWEKLGEDYSIFNQAWPTHDENALVLDTVEIAVQVNGKIIFKLDVATDASSEEVKGIIMEDAKFIEALAGRSIVKFIYVQGRLANIVVK